MGLSLELRGVLKREVVRSPKGDSIILEEPNVGMKVEVTKPSGSVVAVDMDKIGHLDCIKEGKDSKKKCDYLLAFKSNGRDHVVLVELKQTLKDGSKTKEQMRRSLPLLEYLSSFCEIHYEHSRLKLGVRYFIIAEKDGRQFDKQTVRTTPGLRLEEGEYKGVRVTSYFGTSISFAALSSTPAGVLAGQPVP